MTFKQAISLLLGLAFLALSVAAFREAALVFATGAAISAFGWLGFTQYFAMKKQILSRLAKERAEEVLPNFVIKDSFKDWDYEKKREAKALKALPSLVLLISAIALGITLLVFGTTDLGRELITTQSIFNFVSDVARALAAREI